MKKSDNINRSQRLFIELGTALRLEPESRDRSVSSHLVGMQVGKYLIVQMAGDNLSRTSLQARENLRAKYILSDDVFGFKTRIIRAIEDPDHILFLEYPQIVESCNIRSHKRVECFLPVRITINQSFLKAVIVNINKKGCLCQADDCQEVDCTGTREVIIQLPYGQFENLAVKGEIRSRRQQGNQTSFGILFDNLDGFSQKLLSTLVPALKI